MQLEQTLSGVVLEHLRVPDTAPQRVHALVPADVGQLEQRRPARQRWLTTERLGVEPQAHRMIDSAAGRLQ